MGFWGKVGGAFKKVGKGAVKGIQVAAPAVGIAAAFVPGIPPVAVIMLQKAAAATSKAERTFPQHGTGQQKFRWATATVSDGLAMMPEIEQLAGRNIVDEKAFQRAIDLSVEFQVQLAKALGTEGKPVEVVAPR